MAKGVHFRGTVSSVQGYAVGVAGSETMVIDTNGNINVSGLTSTTTTITTATITTGNITTGNITTLTGGNVSLAAATSNSIKIGTVNTGWNNTASNISYNNLTSATVTVDNNIMKVTVGAALYHSVTLAPTGGYLGQPLYLVITAGGTGGVVSFANTNVTVLSTGTITVTGTSTYVVTFVRSLDRFYEVTRTGAQS